MGSTADPNLVPSNPPQSSPPDPALHRDRVPQITSLSACSIHLGPTVQQHLRASTKKVSTACSLIMTPHSIAVGLAIFAGLALLYNLLAALLSPLRKVPGPVSARFTNLFYLNRVRHGRFHHENKALHRKYGPVLRLGEDLVSIDDPSALKTIYGSKCLYRDFSRLLDYLTSDMAMWMGFRNRMRLFFLSYFCARGWGGGCTRINSLTKLESRF